MDLDNIDRQIISMLQLDGRRPYTSIAQELGLSEGAVRNRAQRLIQAEIIQIVAVADPLRVGYGYLHMIDVVTETGAALEVAERMVALDDVNWVALMGSGNARVRVEVICRSVEHFRTVLIEKIERVEGVVSTEPQTILQLLKTNYGWGVPEAGE